VDNKLPNPELHLFICTNHREAGESCAGKGAMELFQSVKDAVRSEATTKDRVKVSKSGCLGLCSQGIAGVHYPSGKWMTDLSEKSSGLVISEIKSKLETL